jgi:hypothetical protein
MANFGEDEKERMYEVQLIPLLAVEDSGKDCPVTTSPLHHSLGSLAFQNSWQPFSLYISSASYENERVCRFYPFSLAFRFELK